VAKIVMGIRLRQAAQRGWIPCHDLSRPPAKPEGFLLD
jgi:hypothetical protein